MAITSNPFKRQPLASEQNYSNPRRSMPRVTQRPITGQNRPQQLTMPPQPMYGTPPQSMLQQRNPFAPSGNGVSNPPTLSGIGSVANPPTLGGTGRVPNPPTLPGGPVNRPQLQPQPQRPVQTFGGGPGNQGSPFGMQQRPNVQSQNTSAPFNPLGTQSYDQRNMSGGANSIDGAGGSNPWGFDQAARGALDRQNAIMGLFNQARQGLAPMQANLMNDYRNPQGMGAETMTALKRQGDVQNAFAMARQQQDARQKLGASGFAGSPVAALMDAGIKGAATRGDIDRNAGLQVQDSQMRTQQSQFAMQQLAGLLGLDLSSAVGMGENIGRMQTPYLTPEGAAAAGVGGGGNALGATGGAFPGSAVAAGGFAGPAPGTQNMRPAASQWEAGAGSYRPTTQQFQSMNADQLRALRRMEEMRLAGLGNPYQMIQGGGGY